MDQIEKYIEELMEKVHRIVPSGTSKKIMQG